MKNMSLEVIPHFLNTLPSPIREAGENSRVDGDFIVSNPQKTNYRRLNYRR
jgi:hypothetical protein